MQEELISVIVPVYNVENYLERCMISLLNQRYTNYEVLLIDDGSKDSSGKLCDKFATVHDKVKTFHKENGGLGSARNYGMEHAVGKYVCFVDSDDQVDRDYLKELYYALKKYGADISVCGYLYSSGTFTASYAFEDGVFNTDEILKKFACGNSFFNFAWNKLYRKEIFDKMPMCYSERHCAEDMYFNTFYYRYINKAAMVKKTLYTYYVNLASLSNGRRPHFWEDMLLVYDAFAETCRIKQIPVEYANNLLTVMLRNSISNFFNKKTSIRSCRKYVEKCLEKRNVCDLKILQGKLGKVDRLLYNAVRKKRYITIYIYMKFIKWIKVKCFKTFCMIRESGSNRR